MIDHDDIQAEENRRREVAVKAGASALATKYEDSPYKKLIAETVEEMTPSTEGEFKELLKNDPKPGYNFVAASTLTRSADEIIAANKEAISKTNQEDKELVKLQEEARKNEPHITTTDTNQPKVVDGEVQDTLQDNEGSGIKPSESGTVKPNSNPSPLGSGDARATAASTKPESNPSGSANTQKK